MGFIVGGLLCLLNGGVLAAGAQPIKLDKVAIDLSDKPALQRGAQVFMNHCAGCHSLKYVRYQNMAKDIGIVDMDGKVLDNILKKNLMFVGDKVTDMIQVSMTREQGANWFGIAPPDLSLVARSRGADWLYTYLRSFYEDDKRPWGVNNLVFPEVAMPHVLLELQGNQVLSGDKNSPLRLANVGKLNQQQYDQAIQDLVNFLVYVGEPAQETRKNVGVWVLLFLGVFFVFAFLLKKEYWKDIH
jgi:ubiquinol-cytochrome c reductase cytochrome c1 subunit